MLGIGALEALGSEYQACFDDRTGAMALEALFLTVSAVPFLPLLTRESTRKLRYQQLRLLFDAENCADFPIAPEDTVGFFHAHLADLLPKGRGELCVLHLGELHERVVGLSNHAEGTVFKQESSLFMALPG
jgi:hypothetical protein